MHTIKHILARYTAFLWGIVHPLGIWGVFVSQNHARWLLYVLMAAIGSALGSLMVYGIGYAGGEELLRKRVSAERFQKLHDAFDKHPFWSLMFPAMLPPPTPFKMFALGAAVSEMQFGHFLLAIFAGRFVRFLLLSILTLKFGPQFVRIFGDVFREHWAWVLAAVAIGLLVWLITIRLKRREN